MWGHHAAMVSFGWEVSSWLVDSHFPLYLRESEHLSCLFLQGHWSHNESPNLMISSKLNFLTKVPTPDNFVTSFQFSSVAQLCPTLCEPMNRSTPGLPVHFIGEVKASTHEFGGDIIQFTAYSLQISPSLWYKKTYTFIIVLYDEQK